MSSKEQAQIAAQTQESLKQITTMMSKVFTEMHNNKEEIKGDMKSATEEMKSCVANLEAKVDKKFEKTESAISDLSNELTKLKGLVSNQQDQINNITKKDEEGDVAMADDGSTSSGPALQASKKAK